MRVRTMKDCETENKRMLDSNELQTYLGLGRHTAENFARECGAARRIGRRVLFDRTVLDKALDGLTQ